MFEAVNWAGHQRTRLCHTTAGLAHNASQQTNQQFVLAHVCKKLDVVLCAEKNRVLDYFRGGAHFDSIVLLAYLKHN